MFDEINFRKFGLILAVLGGGFYYAKTHIHMEQVLAYAKARPDHVERARDIYYVGMVYWMNSDIAGATDTFNILAAEETTTYYTPKALMRLGSCYRDMNRFAESKAVYERYLEEYPKGEDTQIVQTNYEFVKMR